MPKHLPVFALLLIMACLLLSVPGFAAEQPDGFRSDKFMTPKSDYPNMTLLDTGSGEFFEIRIYRKEKEILNFNGIPLKDVHYHFYADDTSEDLADVIVYFYDEQSYTTFVEYLLTRYGEPESVYEKDYYWRWYEMEELGGVAIYTLCDPANKEFSVGFGIVPID